MESRLRIIQAVNVRWFNATAWYGLSLSRLLLDAGHDVRVLALPDTESYKKAVEMGLKPLGLNLNVTNPLYLPAMVREMNRLVRSFQPHIVHCHRGESVILWGMLKATGHGFTLVRTRGDQRPPKGNIPNRLLHNHLVDALIATNTRTAAQCRSLLGIPADRIATVYGGVDTDRFFPDSKGRQWTRAALGFGPDDFVIGLLGRFDHVKGQKELIDAVRLLRDGKNLSDTHPASRLRIMLLGFPTQVKEEDVNRWIQDSGLGESVVITGKVDDVTAYINAMDLGVIASQGSEAIARAAFEIMACGIPLIGTDVGVMPDLLADHALVKTGDTRAMAELVEKAFTDMAFRDTLRAEQYVRMQDLSNQEFLQRTLAVYQTALQRSANK